MPRETVRTDSGKRLRLSPIAGRGLDLRSSPDLVESGFLARSEFVRTDKRSVRRADGDKKVAVLTDASKSLTFNDVGKYGTIPAAAQLKIPYGGFAFYFHVTATRGAAVGYVVSTMTDVAAQSIAVRLGTNGAFTVFVTWEDASQSSIVSSVVADESAQHGLLVFDAVAGTLTLYLNGAASGTPVTGISATKRPVQTAVNWLVGITNAAATYSAPFAGAIDSLTLLALRGQRLADGDPTGLSTLRALSFQSWPNPTDPRCLFHYDFDEGTGAVAKDRARTFKNHMALTGAVTWSDPVALRASPSNLVSVLAKPNGQRTNLWMAGGALSYETVAGATA